MAKKKKGNGKVVGVVLVALVAFVLLQIFVVIPRVVAAKIESAADKRALSIAYGSASYRFTHAEVRDVTLTPKGSKRLTLKAEQIDARIYGLSPSWVIIPRLDANANGSVAQVLDALEPVRKADEALPAAERLPVDVSGGTFTWNAPFGDGSKLEFRDFKALLRPNESSLTADLKRGRITLGGASLDGLTVSLRRDTKAGEKLDLRAALASDDDSAATVELHKKGELVELDVDVQKLSLGQASFDVQGLDLSKAMVDAKITAERDDEGAVRSSGRLSLAKVRLPPIKVGPVSFAIGGNLKVSWKGVPKKGAPGTLVLEDAKVEVALGGRTRSVKITGEIAFGKKGDGPYVVDLGWSTGPFSCAELAADAGGALAKGLAASAVSGTVRARGTLKGDLGDPSTLKPSMEILEACSLDVAKGIGGVLDALPF